MNILFKKNQVFMNASGDHTIISFHSGSNYYINARPRTQTRAFLLKKLNGIVIESVAFNSPFETTTSTKAILVGSNDGKIYETLIDERDRYVKVRLGLLGLLQTNKKQNKNPTN